MWQRRPLCPPAGPELAVSLEPAIELFQAFRLAAAGSILGGAAAFDQAGLFEDLEVSGDSREGHVEGSGEVLHGGFAPGEGGEDGPSGGVGEGRKEGAEVVGCHRVVNRLFN